MKAEMQRRRKDVDAQIKQAEDDNKKGYVFYANLVRIRELYLLSETTPVKLKNGVVVNEKLINRFLRKLPAHAKPELHLEDGSVTIKYSTGQIEMLCLGKFYEDMKLPEREGVLSEDRKSIA